jgi:hypothetical protein
MKTDFADSDGEDEVPQIDLQLEGQNSAVAAGYMDPVGSISSG